MSSSDIQVQGSNDWSIVSKLSVITSGYFNDTILKRFVAKPSKRSSLINRGYYVRAKAIDFILQNFILNHRMCQVVSLGAGFDSSYFRLQEDHQEYLTYVEVDFPDVVKKKWNIIQNDKVLSEAAKTGHYHLQPADLRDLEAFARLMQDVKLDFQQPTLFFSECSITYMDEPSSSRLIEWCAENFLNAVFCVYEQIEPNDGFGFVMQQHFNKLGIPLLSLPVYQNKDLQRRRYREKGWQSCEVYDMNEYHENLIEEIEWTRIKGLEPFDEYEGFHSKCSHYIILTASKGYCNTLLPPPVNQEVGIGCFKEEISWKLSESSVRRYGQAGVTLNGKLWIIGGFGPRVDGGGGHGRLDDLITITEDSSTKSLKWDVQRVVRCKSLARMFATVNSITTDQGSALVIFGGRTHPANALSDVLFCEISDVDIMNVVQLSCTNKFQTDAPAPRWRHATCTVLMKDKENCILIAGGRGIETVWSDCWILEIGGCPGARQVRWKPFPELPAERHSHSASYWNGQVIIFGGLNRLERCINDLQVCSVDCKSLWSAPSWSGPKPLPRYSHQAQVVQDRLVLVGGISTFSCRIGVCIIDLLRWNCVEYSLPEQDPNWPVILCSSTMFCEAGENEHLRIWCHAGGCNCFSFGTHLNGVGIEMHLNFV